MKRLILSLMVATWICAAAYGIDRSETRMEQRSECAADAQIRFVRKVTVYQRDHNGGVRSFTMHLVKSQNGYGLSSGPVGDLGYLEAWAVSRNPNYDPRSNELERRYSHYALVSGNRTYFNL